MRINTHRLDGRMSFRRKILYARIRSDQNLPNQKIQAVNGLRVGADEYCPSDTRRNRFALRRERKK